MLGSEEPSTSEPQINSSTCDSPPPGTFRRPSTRGAIPMLLMPARPARPETFPRAISKFNSVEPSMSCPKTTSSVFLQRFLCVNSKQKEMQKNSVSKRLKHQNVSRFIHLRRTSPQRPGSGTWDVINSANKCLSKMAGLEKTLFQWKKPTWKRNREALRARSQQPMLWGAGRSDVEVAIARGMLRSQRRHVTAQKPGLETSVHWSCLLYRAVGFWIQKPYSILLFPSLFASPKHKQHPGSCRNKEVQENSSEHFNTFYPAKKNENSEKVWLLHC